MEVGQHGPHHPEFVSRINEQVRLAFRGLDSAGLAGGEFQRANRRGADSDDAAIGFQGRIDSRGRVRVDVIRLAMQAVFLNTAGSQWLKSSQAYVQGDFRSFDATSANSLENLGSEMQPGCRSRYRSALAGIDSLIALQISPAVIAMDIRRQGYVSQTLHHALEICDREKADTTLPIAAACDHLRLKFPVAKVQTLANTNLAPGTHQAFPFIGLRRKLMSQQDFNLPAQEIASCRVAGAEALRPRSAAPAIQPRRKHPGVIENDEVVRPKGIGKFGKAAVLRLSCAAVEAQHSRRRTVAQRLLGYGFFRQIVMKVREKHESELIFSKTGALRAGEAITGLCGPANVRYHTRTESVQTSPPP